MMDLIEWRAILVLALIFVPLERLLPIRREQRIFRRHWVNDTVYLLFNGILIKLGFLLLIGAAMVGIEKIMPASVGGFVSAQPLWLQVIAALIIADVGFYAAHRMFHHVPALWRFHVIHHSIEELDWLAAHRVHPIDQIVTGTLSYLPLLALGFSIEAIALHGLIYMWQSHLIHSNVKVDFGPLTWIFASPRFHHWHHADHEDAYDRNFSGQLIFMDALFGTLRIPPTMPEKLGVDAPVPVLYHAQLLHPFRREQATASA
nr:sterol desaturase family protein [Polymorphobacter sp.]